MRELFDDSKVDFVLAVVPTTALKGDQISGFLGDWNKCNVQITKIIKTGQGWPKKYDGAVITYQQLPNLVTTIQTWVRAGCRLAFVFDEIHHTSESNAWGRAANLCGDMAAHTLSMTGTPFRSDGEPISFFEYDADKKATADFRYSYREAVTNKDCRPVLFDVADGIAEYIEDGENIETRISHSEQEDHGKVGATVFSDQSTWLSQQIQKADAHLEDYRATDLDAGGIIICRPGRSEEEEERHLHKVAKLVKRTTGEMPTVISHDDADANDKIAEFRKSSKKWICAVRKVSEGVDIKRLRVMLMASNPTSQLLFRQMVGRVVRVEEKNGMEDARVLIAAFPHLQKWAEQLEEEANEGLKTRHETEQKEREERENRGSFEIVDASHEESGSISSFGEHFSFEEITRAEAMKRGDAMLSHVPAATIAHLLRKQNIEVEPEETQEPIYITKKRLRVEINNVARNVAFKRDPQHPQFKQVWREVHRQFGIKGIDDLMDNYDVQDMERVLRFLKTSKVQSHVA